MTTELKHDVAKVASQFQINGDFVRAEPYGTGHINDTYASSIKTASGLVRFIHQRINQTVFARPGELMENIARVTEHQSEKNNRSWWRSAAEIADYYQDRRWR